MAESEVSTTAEEMKTEADKPKQEGKTVERQQEAELRSKFPNIRGTGASALLQKRLSKGTKYFDSGDYNMAKAKTPAPKLPTAPPGHKLLMPDIDVESPPTGSTIPTPETVPQRKACLQQSKLVTAS